MSNRDVPSEQARSLAASLVAIPSVNPALEAGGSGEAEVATFAADWLRARGFDVELVEAEAGRPSVVARVARGSGRRILLNGHLDTVGEAGMTVPARGSERQGRLYGRGACDMKGGIAALMVAAADVAAEESWSGEILVALTADEEHASLGMSAVLASGLNADAAIVCEPTGLAVMPAHKGFVWIEVEVRGRAAHGSRPDLGLDAIRSAGRFLARLDRLEADFAARLPHRLLGRGSLHAGTISGGTTPSVYADRCVMVIEHRTLPAEPPETSLEAVVMLIRSIAAERRDFDASARILLARAGSEVPIGAPFVKTLLDTIKDAGVAPRVEGMSAWVDAALLNSAGIPAVCFGPGSLARAHTPDEWIALDEIAAATGILRDFLLSFLG